MRNSKGSYLGSFPVDHGYPENSYGKLRRTRGRPRLPRGSRMKKSLPAWDIRALPAIGTSTGHPTGNISNISRDNPYGKLIESITLDLSGRKFSGVGTSCLHLWFVLALSAALFILSSKNKDCLLFWLWKTTIKQYIRYMTTCSCRRRATKESGFPGCLQLRNTP